ncbi:hypothetical protein QBC34DRAFT_386862 [Podospora aff. communis PSN243]|uniref:Cyanovirin-N domain-containing protein n=1 Tax=Podospora aff. communis PSN243 TaxID=3040156 RepID=A0AAV9G1V5_9PEZI|nr:hypothetical protein QBC34DRAFT_386862 [Podospora aff. communis PSN243]
MRIQTATLALAAILSAGVVADDVMSYTACEDEKCFRDRAFWLNQHGESFAINAGDGCSGRGVPGIGDICFDWSQSRLKFFPTAGGQRCLRRKAGHELNHGCPLNYRCWYDYWAEVQCDW